MSTLQAAELSLSYENQTIIDGLDLSIPPGRMTALVGPNGCGKSTLLRGLSRLLKPRGGAVYLNSKAILTLNAKEVAKQIGILPQNPIAPEGLTVYELVAQGRYPYQSYLSHHVTRRPALCAFMANSADRLAAGLGVAASGHDRQYCFWRGRDISC